MGVLNIEVMGEMLQLRLSQVDEFFSFKTLSKFFNFPVKFFLFQRCKQQQYFLIQEKDRIFKRTAEDPKNCKLSKVKRMKLRTSLSAGKETTMNGGKFFRKAMFVKLSQRKFRAIILRTKLGATQLVYLLAQMS